MHIAIENWIKRLGNGDEVCWTDPDNGICSKSLIINTIEIIGDMVVITDENGDTLECLAEELS